MLYSLVVMLNVHWGVTADATKLQQVVTHADISLEQCQAESTSWMNWQNELRKKMGTNGKVDIYATCLPEGSGTNWWFIP